MTRRLLAFFDSQIIVTAVLGGMALGMLLPEQAGSVQALGLTPWSIALVFFCQGMGLDRLGRHAGQALFKTCLAGGIFSLLFFPCMGWLVLETFHIGGDQRVGLLLMCCLPSTLVSATIIAGQAGGDQSASLLLTVSGSIACVLISPWSVSIFLHSQCPVDTWTLLRSLALEVMLPALAGYALIRRLEARTQLRQKLKPWLRYTPVFCLALLIFSGSSQMRSRMGSISGGDWPALIGACIVLHVLALVLAAALGKALSLQRPLLLSLMFSASQKTLPLTIAIWTAHLAAQHPLALVAPTLYHLTQISIGSILAGRLRPPTTMP